MKHVAICLVILLGILKFEIFCETDDSIHLDDTKNDPVSRIN